VLGDLSFSWAKDFSYLPYEPLMATRPLASHTASDLKERKPQKEEATMPLYNLIRVIYLSHSVPEN
jgi:hypothetical protein